MKQLMRAPKVRSPLHFKLGTMWFRWKRTLAWYTGGLKFARRRTGYHCPHIFAAHATPLLRKLKDVDMVLQHNKVENLKLAAARLDGLVLRPGETFSYWKCIGNPTAGKGYREGMLLRNGRPVAAVGGGLCQMSNLIYWMTLHTPLTVTERHRHGYDAFPDSNRTQPFGSGATCFYNYLDLMVRNDTPHVFCLRVRVGKKNLEGEWRCDAPAGRRYEVYEKEHEMRSEYWGGYTRHNVIFRRVFDLSGTLLVDEYVTENHAVMMYSPLLPEGGETGPGEKEERPSYDL